MEVNLCLVLNGCLEGKEAPPFSTLNADVIPTENLRSSLNRHMPKIDPDLIREIWKTIGVKSCDERVYKVASVMMEQQMLKIIQELKLVSAQNAGGAGVSSAKDAASLRTKDGSLRSSHISFDDLSKTMEEFDLVLRRPPFLEEKAHSMLASGQATGGGASAIGAHHARPHQAYASMHSAMPQKRFNTGE